MGVVLLTIPYSGTHFTEDLFRQRGYTICGMMDDPKEERVCFVGHCASDTMIDRALELAQTRPLITTFRHPFRVEEAHRRLANPQKAYRSLRNYFSRVLPANPIIIPVDSPKRDAHLQELEFSLGESFETDWGVKSCKAGTWDMDLSEFRPSEEIQQLCVEQQDFLNALYEV